MRTSDDMWIGPAAMTLSSSAHALTAVAAEEGGHINPLVTGGGAFLVLLLLLWITTRFNRDR